MKNLRKIVFFALVITIAFSTSFVFAANPSYKGATEISSDKEEYNASYSSETGGENALLVSGGNVKISGLVVTKSGDENGENSDFYGTNAGILVYNGATLSLAGTNRITTTAGHANGVFAYGTGTINIEETTINTSSNNSGGIMVAGGGTINAKNLTVETNGDSSAPIRSDRGGGTIIVDGGNYTSNGAGSPAVYSTADITISNANLTSTKSEGIVVEGANSVVLDKVWLVDTNNVLHGNSETYKNIFIYQSQSGDAAEGTGSFSSKDGVIETNNGDMIYVTNTNAVIKLESNVIENKGNGCLLRAEGAKWGKTNANGGNVTLTAIAQPLEGDIILDNLSTLNMNVLQGSSYKGALNADNTAKSVELTLDAQSSFTLTSDCYISKLNNSITDNSNIDLNGFVLHVGNEEISSTEYTGVIGGSDKVSTSETTVEEKAKSAETITETPDRPNMTLFYVIGVVIVLVLALVVIYFIAVRNRRKNKRKLKKAKKYAK